MKQALKWFSPDCPIGPAWGGIFMFLLILFIAILVVPPLIHYGGFIIGPWMRYWL
jgi:hypothetical protein